MGEHSNPPAFPVTVKRNTSTDPLATPREIQMEGMSLRDYFAGQALAGLLSGLGSRILMGEAAKITAREAFMAADAMLNQRESK